MATSSTKMIKQFKRAGWVIDRQKGLHVTLKKNEKSITIPDHGSKDLSIGLEKALLKMLKKG